MAEFPVAVAGYTASRRIDSGGMAEVYLARHPATDRQVALKLMKASVADRANARQRFMLEVKTLGALSHENIVSIIDAGVADDGRPFLVMDFIDGQSLRAVLRLERALSPSRACLIASQIARALDYVHAQGVAHRDLKPENVLLVPNSDGSERVVLIDFGIACCFDLEHEQTKLTETGNMLGTPQYMSPEQARGEPDVGPETDIHALGTLLYEMLVGKPPHSGETRQAALHHVLFHRPEPLPSQLKAALPEAAPLIERSLDKARERRPTAGEFAAALQPRVTRFNDLDSSLDTLESAPALEYAPATPRRTWTPYAVGALALGVGLGAGWQGHAVKFKRQQERLSKSQLAQTTAMQQGQTPSVSAEPVLASDGLELPEVVSMSGPELQRPRAEAAESLERPASLEPAQAESPPSARNQQPLAHQLPLTHKPLARKPATQRSTSSVATPPPTLPSTPAVAPTNDVRTLDTARRTKSLAERMMGNPYSEKNK